MQVIYGVNPVKETLIGKNVSVEEIILAKGKKGRHIQDILDLAKGRHIPVRYDDRHQMNAIAGSKSHQGIVCICADYLYASVDEIISNSLDSLAGGFVLILDGIEDPQNLGSIIRTGHCFGINGIIIPEHRSASVTPSVIKVSAGAAQHVPIAKVVNMARTLDYLKEKNFWIYGADAHSHDDMYTLDFTGNIGLVMGSEDKGLRPLVRKKCDFLISLKMLGRIDSLNVSVAAGIIMYEISRKLRK